MNAPEQLCLAANVHRTQTLSTSMNVSNYNQAWVLKFIIPFIVHTATCIGAPTVRLVSHPELEQNGGLATRDYSKAESRAGGVQV